MEKLYIVVRNDLDPGLQMAQVYHAGREFVARQPELELQWYRGSNNLAVLQVPSMEALALLCKRADALGIAYADFHEADLGGELTAVSFAAEGRRILSSLPRALRSSPPLLAAHP
jgi:peptidyl-tRNA hydrolase